MKPPLYLVGEMLLGVYSQQTSDDGDASEAQGSKVDGLESLAVCGGDGASDGGKDGGSHARGLCDGTGGHGCEHAGNVGSGETCSGGSAADDGGEGGCQSVGQDGGIYGYGNGTTWEKRLAMCKRSMIERGTYQLHG